jgi:mRNA interferase RelE/StbE
VDSSEEKKKKLADRAVKGAVKAYRALPEDVRRRIEPKVDAVAENPRPHGERKIEGEEFAYRVRVVDYRIVHEVHDRALIVVVMNVGHRREIYRRT